MKPRKRVRKQQNKTTKASIKRTFHKGGIVKETSKIFENKS